MNAIVNALPGAEDIRVTRLDNGIRVFSRTNATSPVVVIGGFIHAGSVYDPPDRIGLAALTARGLMRGTKNYTFHEIYTQLEDVGASLGFSAGVHTVSFNGRTLAEDLPTLLHLLTEALRYPRFAPKEIEQLKTQVLTGLRLRADDTESMAALTFDALLFGETHPYGIPSSGFPESVAQLTAADLTAFHAQHYGPRDMTMILVGAIDHDTIIGQIQALLGDWRNPQQPPVAKVAPIHPPTQPRSRHISIPAKEQVDLVLGTTAPPRTDPDFIPAMLANAILGQFGMMGRIGEAVRERAGLAYYAYSSINSGLSVSSWTVSAGVNTRQVSQALDIIRAELQHFTEEGVTQSELDEVRQGMLNRIPLSLESNAGVLSALATIARYHLDLDHYRHYQQRLAAVTVADVNRVIRHYIRPDALVCASAGTLPETP